MVIVRVWHGLWIWGLMLLVATVVVSRHDAGFIRFAGGGAEEESRMECMGAVGGLLYVA
jgi:hypothetical protein